MKEYKDYNNHCIQWMGNIPSHWNSLGLKRTINLINEKTTDESLTYIGLENIESFTGRLSNTKFVTADSTCNLFKIGDILFNKLRPYLTKSIIADFEGKCTTELLVLRGFKGDTKYLNYILLSPEYIGYIDSSTYGSKMPRANWNFIGNVNIPYPPLVEQQHIVSFLDEKTAKIDEYIDKKNKEIETLKEWKKALIAHVVTKGLNTNAKMKDSGVSWIGEIPEHWKVKTLRHYLKIVSVKGFPDETLLSVVREQGVIVRNTESQEENHNFIPDDLSGYKLVKKGQFAINKMKSWQGSYGVSQYQGIVSPAYYVCDLNFDNKRFFNEAIRSQVYIPFFTQYSKGIRVGQWDLSPIGLKSIPFIEPPIEEQLEIVEYIDAATTKADKMIVELTNHVESMKEYKQRLIADVVTGKINVQPCNTCL